MLNGLDKIEGLTPEMQEQINALASGLSTKNSELLEKLSGSKAGSEATAAELEALKLFKQNADVKASEDAASYQEAKELTANSHKAELQRLAEQIATFEQGERTRLITDGIRSELTALKVNPLLSDAMTALFESQSQVIDGKAMIGDQTQSEYIKAWSTTDSGKASILGQQNSGAGGEGGKNTDPNAPVANDAAEAALKNGDVQAYLKATEPT